jgi:tetratricopeptide (TPR) repeat protein
LQQQQISNLLSTSYSLATTEKPAAAIVYLDKALAIDPNNEIALSSKGNALDNLGNHTGAIQYYDKALAIDPNDKIALNGKHRALSKLGH